jgi:arsenate reductase
MSRKRILFLCSHNAARSPMAAALANSLFGDRYEGKSAGSSPRPLRPEAIVVMRELGIDISAHRPTSIKDLGGERFDYLVTLCPDTEEMCPFYPGADEVMHHGVEDPPGIDGAEAERLAAYRLMRDDIKGFIVATFGP